MAEYVIIFIPIMYESLLVYHSCPGLPYFNRKYGMSFLPSVLSSFIPCLLHLLLQNIFICILSFVDPLFSIIIICVFLQSISSSEDSASVLTSRSTGGKTMECPLCLSQQPPSHFPPIMTCHHRYGLCCVILLVLL